MEPLVSVRTASAIATREVTSHGIDPERGHQRGGLRPGSLVGRYHVDCEIGRGASGIVYRGVDQWLDRRVALKALSVRRGSRAIARAEAQLLSGVASPHVPAVYDIVETPEWTILVMELADGSSITELVSSGPMATAQALRLGRQLARGLMAVHRAGIVHRDIKPANLRMSTDGLLKILDFGVAARRLVPHTSARRRTLIVVGTVPYMSPEQLCGEEVGAESDLYSAGAVLYEMLTGRRACPATSHAEAVDQILSGSIVPPRAINAHVPRWLDQVVLRALSPRKTVRYDSAEALLAALTAPAPALS